MEPLIFVRRGKASATTQYVMQIEKYCQANGIREFDLSPIIQMEQDVINLEAKIYRAVLELRKASTWSITTPGLVWGYPTHFQDHTGYQGKMWSPMATQLLDWSSTRYCPQFIEPMFPDEGLDLEAALDDLLHQSALLRKDLRPGEYPGVDETIHNMAGGVDKQVALVGDVHNHKEGRMFPQPFLALRNSSLFIHRAMSQLPNGLPWCFNSGDIHAKIVLRWLQHSGVKGFVALGDKAEAWLIKMRVRGYLKVYHPSYARRFNVSLDAYAQDLENAVAQAREVK